MDTNDAFQLLLISPLITLLHKIKRIHTLSCEFAFIIGKLLKNNEIGA